MARLTNEQRRRLAEALIRAAGDLVSGGAEVPAAFPEDIPVHLAAEQLAVWLRRLPHDNWDIALPSDQSRRS